MGFMIIAVVLTVALYTVKIMATSARRKRLRTVAAGRDWTYAPRVRDLPGRRLPFSFFWGSSRDIMTGQHGSSAFVAFTAVTGRNRPDYGVVGVQLPNMLPELELTREGMGTAIAKAFGGQDLLVGHPQFDARYRIQSRDPGYVVTLLNPAVVAWFMAPRRWENFAVRGGFLQAWTPGGLSYEQLPWVLDELNDLVARIGEDVWGGWGAPTYPLNR
ncbi:MAG: hypothetical protein FWF02_00050 [Micrococcales bacterium]|nr:hypothetical protein [Micrococcales bacterium]MCL2666090.1 hypothetical protein [Micrococcales bacterium]